MKEPPKNYLNHKCIKIDCDYYDIQKLCTPDGGFVMCHHICRHLWGITDDW